MHKSRRRHPAHVYLLPAVAAAARSRADQLGLPLSAYFAVLLRNHEITGQPDVRSLVRDETSKEVRERIPFSVTPETWAVANAAAAGLGGTTSLLVEALVVADLSAPGSDLVLHSRKPKPKLR